MQDKELYGHILGIQHLWVVRAVNLDLSGGEVVRGGPQFSDSVLSWLPASNGKDRSNDQTTRVFTRVKARVALVC